MTPQEKAEELIEKFYDIVYPDKYLGMTKYESIHCAMITVEEILNLNKMDVYMDYTYWGEVKHYLEKLN